LNHQALRSIAPQRPVLVEKYSLRGLGVDFLISVICGVMLLPDGVIFTQPMSLNLSRLPPAHFL
jgi:hypothetical protein